MANRVNPINPADVNMKVNIAGVNLIILLLLPQEHLVQVWNIVSM